MPVLQRGPAWQHAVAELEAELDPSESAAGRHSGQGTSPAWPRTEGDSRRVICRAGNKRIPLPLAVTSLPVPAKILMDNPAWPKLPAGFLPKKTNQSDGEAPTKGPMLARRIVCVVGGRRLLPKKSMFDPKPMFRAGLRILVSYTNAEPNADENWYKATVLRTVGEDSCIAEGTVLFLLSSSLRLVGCVLELTHAFINL